MGPTSSHQVLSIPELISEIFSFLDDASNAKNARVCQRWNEIALDILWHDAQNLYRLFNCLSPLEALEGRYVFSVIPDRKSWDRFSKYARRVRRLHHSQYHWKQLDQRTFLEIEATRPHNQEILPNLHTFIWEDDPQFSIMFMHHRIRNYTMGLPDHLEPASTVANVFPNIVHHMSGITHLDMQIDSPISSFESQAAQFLAALPGLKSVTLPRYHFTTMIAECLARLRNLHCIQLENWERPIRGDPGDTKLFNPTLETDAFPALRELSFVATFHDAQRFLRKLPVPSQLTTLCIQSQDFEIPEAFKILVNWIVDECFDLRVLSLGSLLLPNDQSISGCIPETQRISIDTIRPLLRKREMTSFNLEHQYPLNFSYDNLEEIALAWPRIDTLLLNPAPGYFLTSDLTVNALSPFARHCHNLVELGLFIDATDRQSLKSSRCPSFVALEILDMGLSVIEDEEFIAQFLLKILPQNNRRSVWSEMNWEGPMATTDEKTRYAVAGRIGLWEKVHWLM